MGRQRPEKHGVNVRLNTQLLSAEDGVIELSSGETYETDLLIWTAGIMAHPSAKDFGIPLDARGRVRSSATPQVVDEAGVVVPDVWSCGDVAAVPDLSGDSPLPDDTCVPNAQHAVRQAKRLAKNLVAVLRDEAPIEYVHKNAGAVAGLGPWDGVMKFAGMSFHGPIAWLGHRVYHGFAMPTFERKFRVLGDWLAGFFLRREIASLALGRPRAAFQEYALRPAARARAEAPEAEVAPAAKPRTRKAPATP